MSADQPSQIYIIGYGTFIPNKMFLKSDVCVCMIQHYRRVWTGETVFPFVLEDPESRFYGIVFPVSQTRLEKLDFYEGVTDGLFLREVVEVLLDNGEKISAHMYVPSQKTIEEFHLTLESDTEDRWMEEIRKNQEVCSMFPQLLEKLD